MVKMITTITQMAATPIAGHQLPRWSQGAAIGIRPIAVTWTICVPVAKRLRTVFNFSGRQFNGESPMRKELALLASVAALFTLIAVSAQAMPAASLKGVSNSDQVIHVAEGCGRGWHRGPHGHCRRN
jgi:hypothetical protein